jgi:hypothetical protein
VRIELDLSQAAEWAEAVPTWAYVVSGIVAWYAAAGRVIAKKMLGDGADFEERTVATMFWIFSPFVAFFFAVGAVIWPLAGGIIPPPWKWDLRS